eukprot:3494795-Rhodomonas_salina.4
MWRASRSSTRSRCSACIDPVLSLSGLILFRVFRQVYVKPTLHPELATDPAVQSAGSLQQSVQVRLAPRTLLLEHHSPREGCKRQRQKETEIQRQTDRWGQLTADDKKNNTGRPRAGEQFYELFNTE